MAALLHAVFSKPANKELIIMVIYVDITKHLGSDGPECIDLSHRVCSTIVYQIPPISQCVKPLFLLLSYRGQTTGARICY